MRFQQIILWTYPSCILSFITQNLRPRLCSIQAGFSWRAFAAHLLFPHITTITSPLHHNFSHFSIFLCPRSFLFPVTHPITVCVQGSLPIVCKCHLQQPIIVLCLSMCVWIGQRQQWDEFLDFYLCKRDGVLGPQQTKKKNVLVSNVFQGNHKSANRRALGWSPHLFLIDKNKSVSAG